MVKKETKEIWKQVVFVTVLFAAIDFLAHAIGLLPANETLPQYYYLFKFLFLPFILFGLIWFFKLSPKKLGQAVTICITAAVILQIRYFFLNIYDGQTNLIMIAVHYFSILGAFMIHSRFFERRRRRFFGRRRGRR